MTIVIKEDKREETFSESKLTESIRNTMIEVGDVDNALIDVVLDKINIFIKDKEYILTKDLRNEIIKILATEESSALAKAYMMFVKEGKKLTKRDMADIKENINDPSACGTWD